MTDPKTYVFLWQSDDLCMCSEELTAPDLESAQEAFNTIHPEHACSAVVSYKDHEAEDVQRTPAVRETSMEEILDDVFLTVLRRRTNV